MGINDAAEARMIVIGLTGFIAWIVYLRGARKRTLGDMNALELFVTVALAGTIAELIATADRPQEREPVSFLIALPFQFGVLWLLVNLPRVLRRLRANRRE